MKALGMFLALGLCGVVSAQEVFTNGIDVGGQMVQGVGLIEVSTNNLAWTTHAPSLGQLAGVDTNGNNLADVCLVPLRPAWLETDGIYARTSNGLTLFSATGTPLLQFQNGVIIGGSSSNAVFYGNGAGLTGLTAAQVGVNFYSVGSNNSIVGLSASASGNGAAFGRSALADGTGAAFGYGVNATNYGVAVGVYARGYYQGAGVGYNANGSVYGAALGYYANGSSAGAAVGWYATAINGAALGPAANANYEGAAIGESACGTNAGAAVGYQAKGGAYGAAVGKSANATSSGAALGCYTVANLSGVAIGDQAVGDTYGVALGHLSIGNNDGAALGTLANGSASGVALGADAMGKQNGVAVGSGACGMGLGNVALGGSTSAGTAASVPTNWTDTVELGRGTATLPGGLNFRGRGLVDSNGVVVAAITTTNLVATYMPLQGDVSMGNYTNQPGQ